MKKARYKGFRHRNKVKNRWTWFRKLKKYFFGIKY